MTNALLDLLPDTPTAATKASGRAKRKVAPQVGIVTALTKELAAMQTLLLNAERRTIERPGGGWPIQAVLWLEWGSSIAKFHFSVASSRRPAPLPKVSNA